MRRMYSEKQILELVKSNPEAVVKALEGQDINVNGITSKGIANTGKITGGEIIELMDGYSFIAPSESSIELAYAGVVKTGNKITFVIAGKYTRPEENPPINPYIGEFIIPKSIGDKLYPIASIYIDSRLIRYFDSVSSSGVDKATSMDKKNISGDTTHVKLGVTAYSVHTALTVGTPYMFRYEITFLLSENLVSE